MKLIQVPCRQCEGNGGFTITHEMAIDAGYREMEGQFWKCSGCGGDGWILIAPEPDLLAGEEKL